MVAKKEIAPELLAEARRLYEQTLAPVTDVAGMIGLSRSNFYKRVREGGWRGRRAQVATYGQCVLRDARDQRLDPA